MKNLLDITIDTMKNIKCIEHGGKAKILSPFVGKQLEICEAFGLEIPKGSGISKKASNSKTGRKTKASAQI